MKYEDLEFFIGTGGDGVVDGTHITLDINAGVAVTTRPLLSVVYRKYIVVYQGLPEVPRVRLHLCSLGRVQVRRRSVPPEVHVHDLLRLRPFGIGKLRGAGEAAPVRAIGLGMSSSPLWRPGLRPA